jgi:DNA-binding beta-propeller fold protein YncE
MRIGLPPWMILCLAALTLISCGGGSNGGSVANTPSSPTPTPTPTPAIADFRLSVESATVSPQQGGGPQLETIQATALNGFTGTVNVTLSGLPAGVTASGPLSFNVPGGIAGTTLQLVASQSTLVGPSTITVTATSGSLTHTATFSLNVRQIAPFSIQISSSSVVLTAPSSQTLQVSVTGNPGTSPSLSVNVSPTPSNSQIAIGTSPGLLSPNNPISLSIVAPVLAQPVQNVPLMVVASDGSGNSSLASLSLTVSVPFASNTNPTRSTFTRTDQSPTGMVYDQARKLLFVSVAALDEVVVLSTIDGHKVATIPVALPAAIDEAADGSAVYVTSTITTGVTTIDPNSLQVIGHSDVPASVVGANHSMSFDQAATLSNGSVLLSLTSDAAGILGFPFILWNPATNTFSQFGPSNINSKFDFIKRTPDHTKVLAFGGSTVDALIYDVTTNSFNTTSRVQGLSAIRPDGSQLAGITNTNGSFELAFFDGNFSPITSLPLDELMLNGPAAGTARFFYSLDGKRLYLVPDQGFAFDPGGVVTVVDSSTFSVLGVVPAFSFGAAIPFSAEILTTFSLDETGMLFGATLGGVGFLDLTSPTSLAEPLPELVLVQPSLASLSSSTQAQLDGVGFSQGLPLNLFIGAPPSSSQSLKTTVTPQSDNVANLSIPSGMTAGAANATLTRADGFFEVSPDAVSFGPTILRVDANAGSTAGDDPIKITGYGLSAPNTKVLIGGKEATIMQQIGAFPGRFFPTNVIEIRTPPGTPGLADVTVTTPSGSATVAGGFEYLSSVQVIPVTGLLDAIAYDQQRQRLYLTNQNHNRVEVFDLAGGALLSPIPVGNEPTFVFLTPDGSLLGVVNEMDNTITVIDPNTMQATGTFPVLPPGSTMEFISAIAPAAPHRAFIDITNGNIIESGFFRFIDLDNGTLSCVGIPGCNSNGVDFTFGPPGLAALASSADGNTIFVATNTQGGTPLPTGLISLASNSVTTGPAENFNDASINSDGSLFAGNFALLNSARVVNLMAFETNVDTEITSIHNVFGEKLNSSGSLLYYPQDSGVDIFDTHTGLLVRHLALPGTIPANVNALAIDETGTRMFLTSTTGITIAQLFQTPLSLAAVNPGTGTQGTNVVLRGSGFQSGAVATFGAIQISTTFVDPNTLNAIVPSLPPGPVRVSVTNPDGRQYSLDNAYTAN